MAPATRFHRWAQNSEMEAARKGLSKCGARWRPKTPAATRDATSMITPRTAYRPKDCARCLAADASEVRGMTTRHAARRESLRRASAKCSAGATGPARSPRRIPPRARSSDSRMGSAPTARNVGSEEHPANCPRPAESARSLKLVHHPKLAIATAHARTPGEGPNGDMRRVGTPALTATQGSKRTNRSAPGGVTHTNRWAYTSPATTTAHVVVKSIAARRAGKMPSGELAASAVRLVVDDAHASDDCCGRRDAGGGTG